MPKNATEIGFDTLDEVKVTLKKQRDFLQSDGKFNLFMTVNIIMYGVAVGLGIFRLFGLI